MIKSFRVKSFKSLEDVEVKLGQVNVFIGANGSGKSNLLEALGVLGAAAFGQVDPESLERRGVRVGLPQVYISAFARGGSGRRHFEISASTETSSYEVHLGPGLDAEAGAWTFLREEWLGTDGVHLANRSSANGKLSPTRGLAALELARVPAADQPDAVGLLNALASYGVHAPNTPMLRELIPDRSAREPVGLQGGGLPDGLMGVMDGVTNSPWVGAAFLEAESLLGWARKASVQTRGEGGLHPAVPSTSRIVLFADRFIPLQDGMFMNTSRITSADASEGALYVLYAAVLALHPRTPPIIALDNVDQALNPRLARKLVEALCRWLTHKYRDTSPQLLMTAHNPAVLDGLPLQDDRIRLFAVDRDNFGHTVVRRVLVDAELQALAEKEGTESLSRLWMMGHLGGVPNV